MTDRAGNRRKIQRSLSGSVCGFVFVLAAAILLASCNGGSNTQQPPLTPEASLRGVVTFSEDVPLLNPPGGKLSDGIRYAARLIDPGDDIGQVPLPKPGKLGISGSYDFEKQTPKPIVYFNLLFNVNANLDGRSPYNHMLVGFNIPISLADGFSSLLSANISHPASSVLQMTYSYSGPDGAREVRLQLDFAADLLSFDLDSDGVFDDLVTIDVDHDGVPDSLAPSLINMDYTKAFQTYGTVTAIGSNSVSVDGKPFDITGIANMSNPQTQIAMALSDFRIGDTVTAASVPSNGSNLAVRVEILPRPSDKPGVLTVQRDGVIEQVDATSITVSGIWFHDYAQAKILNSTGDPVDPSDLKVGTWTSVTGTRQETRITADKIVVEPTAPFPGTFEREGTILAVNREGNPATVVLGGIVLNLTDSTVIKDQSDQVLDRTALKVGDPARVSAHAEGSTLIADIIRLQFVVEKPNEKTLRVVVLYNDPAKLPEIESAIAQIGSPIPVVAILVANGPDGSSCLDDVYSAFETDYLVLKGLQGSGFLDAYPRLENGQCSVLVTVEDGFPRIIYWIDLLFPNGIGGAPLEFDRSVLDMPYGAGPEYGQAAVAAHDLVGKLSIESYVMIYVSAQKDFSS